MVEKMRIQESKMKPFALLTEVAPEKEIWDFYERIKDRNVGVSLNNFILQAKMVEGKIGGGLIHDYQKVIIALEMNRNYFLDMGFDLDKMTFSQLKQENLYFLKGIVDCILGLIKFGEIMKIPELKF
ncbi:MAG: hypothetical protein AAB740_05195 [Patescibacteria group bacterium]